MPYILILANGKIRVRSDTVCVNLPATHVTGINKQETGSKAAFLYGTLPFFAVSRSPQAIRFKACTGLPVTCQNLRREKYRKNIFLTCCDPTELHQ